MTYIYFNVGVNMGSLCRILMMRYKADSLYLIRQLMNKGRENTWSFDQPYYNWEEMKFTNEEDTITTKMKTVSF